MTQIAPDKAGFARAWDMMTPESIKAGREEWGHDQAGIASWMIQGPYHPFWSWWLVGVVHLRDIPGTPAAKRHYPEAEYEFTIWSIKSPPSGEITPDIEKLRAGDLTARDTILHPCDVVFQFHGVTDEQAAEICEVAVNAIVAGQSCDSDFREWWKTSLAATVQHYVLGVHE